MSYKTVLVHLDSSAQCIERITIACAIAQQQQAHLIGLAPSGVAPNMGGNLAAPAMEVARIQASLDQTADDAVRTFEQYCWRNDNSSFEARRVTEPATDAILQAARFSDLVVIGQAAPMTGQSSTENQGFVEHVLLGAGRPVLIVPNNPRASTVGQRIVCAWDNSVEAARAVTAALPLLKLASLVEIAIVGDPSKRGRGDTNGTEMARFLHRHGIRAPIQALTSGHASDQVADVLLEYMQASDTDLLVMGGYGHSRLREWVLGGTTRRILKSMHTAVLMTH